MQLQKQQSRKYKDKEYAKYTVVIPPRDIERLGWKDGDELVPEIQNNELILKLKKK